MGDVLDELVEKAARAHTEQANRFTPYKPLDAFRAALEAVGLPALLERVEAAEAKVARVSEMLADWDAWPRDQDYKWPSSPKDRERLRAALGVSDHG